MVRITEATGGLFNEPSRAEVIAGKVRHYRFTKSTIKSLTTDANRLRDELSAMVESYGEADSDGHQWLELDSEIEGVSALKRERRVSTRLDEGEAYRRLAAAGLTDRCIRNIPVVDQDEVMAALYEGLLTEEDIDAMFPKSVSWAFVTAKR